LDDRFRASLPNSGNWLKTGLAKTNGTSRCPTSTNSQNQIARLQTVGEGSSVPLAVIRNPNVVGKTAAIAVTGGEAKN
jgi:hypothetical protein